MLSVMMVSKANDQFLKQTRQNEFGAGELTLIEQIKSVNKQFARR